MLLCYVWGYIVLSYFADKTNPDSGQWMTLKEISARLKKVFKGAYTEDEGSYIKIGNYLNCPECQFESDRKSYGMVYWVKER